MESHALSVEPEGMHCDINAHSSPPFIFPPPSSPVSFYYQSFTATAILDLSGGRAYCDKGAGSISGEEKGSNILGC